MTAVMVPCASPVGIVRMPAFSSNAIDSSGNKVVAASTSFTSHPKSASRTAPPTKRKLPGRDANACTSFCVCAQRSQDGFKRFNALLFKDWAPHARERASRFPCAAEQKKLLRKLGKIYFAAAVIVQWAGSNEPMVASHAYAEMLRLADIWQPPEFPLSGDDLIALGVKPGKVMGELLRKLEEEWEMNDYALTKEALLGKAQYLLG